MSERKRDEIDDLIDSLDELPDPLRPDKHSEDESIAYHVGPEPEEDYTFDVGEPPDEDDPRGQTWSTYRIYVQGQSFEDKCRVFWATNDDDDDGYAGDDDSASDNYDFPNVWAALSFTSGGSRVGYGGCVVTVTIDGWEAHTLSEDYQHYRPYCEWPRREGR